MHAQAEDTIYIWQYTHKYEKMDPVLEEICTRNVFLRRIDIKSPFRVVK